LRGEGTRRLLERAHEHGSTTIFDTGWDPEDWTGEAVREVRGLLPLVDIFLPNEPEAVGLTGESDPVRAAEQLAHVSRGWVAVKRGSEGVVAHGPEGANLAVAAPRVTPLDTTGAGDSLAAGLLARLADGADMSDALEMGVRVASTVVQRESRDRYPRREELLTLSG
jgi:sugar/nucleoside kinase (ribokinase family)